MPFYPFSNYTDAEAVSAMGAKADANALNHDKYTDAEALAALGLTTAGDVIVHNGTGPVRLAIGTDDQVLTADSGQTEGLAWKDASGGGGTTQGAGTDTYAILAAAATLAGNQPGESAVDLQSSRSASNQTAETIGSCIGGGASNRVSTGQYGTVGGGLGNWVSALYATIGGGTNNTARDNYGTVGGGNANIVDQVYATVAGGDRNDCNSTYGFIGSGQLNNAGGTASAVCGGSGNDTLSDYAFIGAGLNNTASGYQSVVGGGEGNTASGQGAVVCGGGASGLGNTASATGSAVVGGRFNFASGSYNSVCGGFDNQSGSGTYCVISGGQSHRWTSGNYTGITNGVSCNIFGDYSRAGGAAAQTRWTCHDAWGTKGTTILVGGMVTAGKVGSALRTTDATAAQVLAAWGVTEAGLLSGELRVTAVEKDTGGRARWTGEVSIYRDVAGNVTLIEGGRTSAAPDASAGTVTGWVLDVDADTTGQTLRVRVTGAAATNIQWHAVWRADENTYT